MFFAAFVVATTFPHNLIFLPYQVFSVGQPLAERMWYIGRATATGLAFGLAGSVVVLVAAVATAHETSIGVTVVFTLTAIPTVAISAAQDNLRRMHHVREHHWSAAWMSIIQFAVVSATIAVMVVVDVPIVWMPFGSLFAANIVSTTIGFMAAGGFGRRSIPDTLRWRSLVRRGRWLLGQAIVLPGAIFVSAAIITALAGAVAMGFGEAARIVGQPVIVLSTGFTAVLGPKVMRSAIERDDRRGLRLIGAHAALVVLAGLVWLLVAGWDTPWNPVTAIVPSAYEVAGLTAVSIVAAATSGLVFLRVEELMGAHRETDLVKVSLVASVFAVAVALTAPWTGAFAFPLGLLAMSAARYGGYWFFRRRLYRAVAAPPA